MWRIGFTLVAIVIIGALAFSGRGGGTMAAQDVSSNDLSGHPLIGTWIVDTNVDDTTDPPEIGIFTANGSTFGLGANRWVSGVWEAADDATGAATLAGVFDANGGGYVVLRGLHEVDDTGDAWTCVCTFTVVAPDGTVLVSGTATAHATRMPIETVDAAGAPLEGFPVWAPAQPAAATPAA